MLSTTSEYAVRALVYLALLKEGEAILGRDLAKQSGIPVNYLAKILVMLSKGGFVEASRGPGGGYRLKRPPDQIHLIDVIMVFEGEDTIPSCILRSSRVCSDSLPCGAHSLWSVVREAYIHFLENTTITMISQQNGTIAQVTAAEMTTIKGHQQLHNKCR